MAGITSAVYTNHTFLAIPLLLDTMPVHGVTGHIAVERSTGRVHLDPSAKYPRVLWLRHVADLLLVSLKMFTY